MFFGDFSAVLLFLRVHDWGYYNLVLLMKARRLVGRLGVLQIKRGSTEVYKDSIIIGLGLG